MSNSDRRFYVYLHIRKDNGEIFYVGKGTRGRAYLHSGRNKMWRLIVAKADYEVVFLATGLTHEEANSFEIDTIIHYKAIGQAYVNFTLGGEGSLGSIPDKDVVAQRAASNTGKKKKS